MRRILSTATAIMALALMVPTAGHAEVMQPDCLFSRSTTTYDADGVPTITYLPLQVGDTCSVEFEITEAEKNFHVSILQTHSGFHAVTDAGVIGKTSLQWKDANGAVVAEYSCDTISLRGDGDYEHQTRIPACSELKAAPATLPVGISTLTATVTALQSQTATRKAALHGRLLLRGDELP